MTPADIAAAEKSAVEKLTHDQLQRFNACKCNTRFTATQGKQLVIAKLVLIPGEVTEWRRLPLFTLTCVEVSADFENGHSTVWKACEQGARRLAMFSRDLVQRKERGCFIQVGLKPSEVSHGLFLRQMVSPKTGLGPNGLTLPMLITQPHSADVRKVNLQTYIFEV